MDAANFLGHLRARRNPPPAAPAPAPAPAAPPAAKPKPPFSSQTTPSTFAGRKVGSKNRAPRRRELAAALAAAIGSHDDQHADESTAPDFLDRFGVARTTTHRILNRLDRGEITLPGAAKIFATSAARHARAAGQPVPISITTTAKPPPSEADVLRTAQADASKVVTTAAENAAATSRGVSTAGGSGAGAVGQTSTGGGAAAYRPTSPKAQPVVPAPGAGAGAGSDDDDSDDSEWKPAFVPPPRPKIQTAARPKKKAVIVHDKKLSDLIAAEMESNGGDRDAAKEAVLRGAALPTAPLHPKSSKFDALKKAPLHPKSSAAAKDALKEAMRQVAALPPAPPNTDFGGHL